MPKISKETHGELCDLLSAVSGLLELLKMEGLTEKQNREYEEALKAVIRMRELLNGSLKNSGTYKSIQDEN